MAVLKCEEEEEEEAFIFRAGRPATIRDFFLLPAFLLRPPSSLASIRPMRPKPDLNRAAVIEREKAAAAAAATRASMYLMAMIVNVVALFSEEERVRGRAKPRIMHRPSLLL